VLPSLDRRHHASPGGMRRQDVKFHNVERHGECRHGCRRRNTEEDHVICWIARAQVRLLPVAGGCRPLVVVRGRAVIMVNVIVTTVGMHMDRGGSCQGPSHDDCNAGAEGPAHGKSLTQHGPTDQKMMSPARMP
jgi:hypothetical protein